MNKPIAYPDADLSCGLSTDGILIAGDRKSIDRVKRALHAEQAIVPYLRSQMPGNIEAAAQKLAECMDYPWEFMPEQGRDNMRQHARSIINAAQTEEPPATYSRAVPERSSTWSWVPHD